MIDAFHLVYRLIRCAGSLGSLNQYEQNGDRRARILHSTEKCVSTRCRWFRFWIIFVDGILGQTCSNSEVGVQRSGFWYTFIQTVTTVDACCSMCNAETSRCQSWLFVRPGASSSLTPGCYLYETISPINQSSTCGQSCSSGVKIAALPTTGRCSYPGGVFELAIDRPNSTYIQLQSVSTYPICCALCQVEGDRCRAWTFIRNGAVGRQSGCALKSAIPAISSTPCVPCTSGIKSWKQQNIFFVNSF